MAGFTDSFVIQGTGGQKTKVLQAGEAPPKKSRKESLRDSFF